MADNFVITIGRQFGSGGRDIGRAVAERLGVKCYDKEIIELAAMENNISQDILEKHDEKPMSGILSGMVSDIFPRAIRSLASSMFRSSSRYSWRSSTPLRTSPKRSPA